MLEQGPDFHFRDKWLFEIKEVKITRVNCSSCIIWCTTWEKGTYVICKQRRLSSTCASIQSDLSILCSLTYTTVSIDSVSRQWKPWSACTNVQADLGLHCLQIARGPFCALSIISPPHWYRLFPCYWYQFKNKMWNFVSAVSVQWSEKQKYPFNILAYLPTAHVNSLSDKPAQSPNEHTYFT